MTPLPYTLQAKGSDRYIVAGVAFVPALIPVIIFLKELSRDDDDPDAFGSAGMVALVVAAALLVTGGVWLSRRAAGMSVTIDSEQLSVNNLFRSYSIPLREVSEFEERLTRGNGRTPAVIRILAHHGGGKVPLDAANAQPDEADEFQDPLIQVLQQLARKHGFRLNLINLTDEP